MKKNILLGLMLLGLSSVGYAVARVNAPRWDAIIPSFSGVTDVFRRWAQPSVYAVTGANCNLVHTGKGLLVGVDAVTRAGNLAGFEAYDTITATGYTAGSATPDTLRLIAQAVDTTLADFDNPAPYANGLVLCNRAAGGTSVGRFHKQVQ